MSEKWHRALTLALAVVLIGSAGYLIRKDLDYRRGGRENEAAAAAVSLPALPETPLEAGEEAEARELPEALLDILADIDLEALQAVNEEVVGWIAVPGTEISYPVLLGEDNSYYLNHTWNRVQSAVGSIFLECRCAADLTDFNVILYGHRMRNGTMFGRLRDYSKEDFWRRHPTVYLAANDGVYAYDVYAALTAGTADIVYRLDPEEAEEREALIAYSLSRSAIDTGITPTAEDRVVTLSTCTGRGYAERWVVQGVLRCIWPRQGAEDAG